MAYTTDTHRIYKNLLSRINSFREQWRDDVPVEVINSILEHGRYSYKSTKQVGEKMEEAETRMLYTTGSRDAWDAFAQYAGSLGDAIKNIRRDRKRRDIYAPVLRAVEYSRTIASAAVANGFSRTSINVEKSSSDNPVGLFVYEGRSRYSMKNYIYVGATWGRTIGDRGMALINAPDGLRFVLKCSPRNVMYVDDDGMNAWQVTVIGFKHGKGFTQEGWVVTHKSTEHDHLHPLVNDSRKSEIPHSFGFTLQKAHSLLKSRTVRHLTKMLDG